MFPSFVLGDFFRPGQDKKYELSMGSDIPSTGPASMRLCLDLATSQASSAIHFVFARSTNVAAVQISGP